MTVVLAPPRLLVKEKLAKFLPHGRHFVYRLELEVIVWNTGCVTTSNEKNKPCYKVISL